MQAQLDHLTEALVDRIELLQRAVEREDPIQLDLETMLRVRERHGGGFTS